MKFFYCKNVPKSSLFVIFFTSLLPLKYDFLKAEYIFQDLQIDSSTKTDEDRSAIPTNPFEIVEMIRRNNSMNDATDPTDAIDNALKSFNNVEEE